MAARRAPAPGPPVDYSSEEKMIEQYKTRIADAEERRNEVRCSFIICAGVFVFNSTQVLVLIEGRTFFICSFTLHNLTQLAELSQKCAL